MIWNQKTKGECWVKILTDILVEILQPGSPEVKLGQKDSREMKEVEVVRESGRQREIARERDRGE